VDPSNQFIGTMIKFYQWILLEEVIHITLVAPILLEMRERLVVEGLYDG
jgi:hypothetical protein